MSGYVDLSAEDLLGPDSSLSLQQLHEFIESLCERKASEFTLFGYHRIAGADVWRTLTMRYKSSGYPALHVLIEDLVSFTVNDYMTSSTIMMYRHER